MKSTQPEPLWRPDSGRIAGSRLADFCQFLAREGGPDFAPADYPALYAWSVEDPGRFWAALFRFWNPIFEGPLPRDSRDALSDPVPIYPVPENRWFPGLRWNMAENLLRQRDDSIALDFEGENGARQAWSYQDLYQQVGRLVRFFQERGVGPGDRVAGFVPNIPQTVACMLAANSLGAIWSSSSPDFGIQGVLDRFGQIQPKVLVAGRSYFFKGRHIDCREKTDAIANELPELEAILLLDYPGAPPLPARDSHGRHAPVWHWQDIQNGYSPFNEDEEIPFYRAGFDHPVYIMYSSGTTGLPKCMVQGPGVLLNHWKELALHCDLRPGERIFYYTTCGWMMWNWLVSSLALGATIVLYDGNPFYPETDRLFRLAEAQPGEEGHAGLAVMGVSAKYLAALEKDFHWEGAGRLNLRDLRAILSTGSPLAPESFDYVYRSIKEDVQLSSISGGTDLNGCFALGNPVLPVYRGELQCRGLAMDVEVYDEEGRPLRDQPGELVCRQPFPSMPLYFWGDKTGDRYRKAYFSRFPDVWCHGDFARLTGRGTMRVTGRSDATLNPGGVRIGTAEIYQVLDKIKFVADGVAIGQQWEDDVRVILFVKMAADQELTPERIKSLRQEIREKASPRHVPAKIIPVTDIPYTINMKKVELAVREMVHGETVKNQDALANPECLDQFRPENQPALREA